MATARISESLWTCTKRWRLEAALVKAGHRWPKSYREQRPMCAAEHVARILAWLDQRGRVDGDISDAEDDEIEEAAGWLGDAGLLVACLVSTGWIDHFEDGRREWHDYETFNSLAITARRNGSRGGRPRDPNSVRSKRGDYDGSKTKPVTKPEFRNDETRDETRDVSRDVSRDETRTKPVTKQSGSESGPSLRQTLKRGGSVTESPRATPRATPSRTRTPPLSAPPGQTPEPEPKADPEAPAGLDACGLAEAMVRILEEELPVCRKCAAELAAKGIPEDFSRAILAALEAPIGVWTFKALVLGKWAEKNPPTKPGEIPYVHPNSNGALLARRRAEDAVAAADHDAWLASGMSRTEWVKAKAAGIDPASLRAENK